MGCEHFARLHQLVWFSLRDLRQIGDSEEELQQLTPKNWSQQLQDTEWKSAPTKSKILVNSTKPRPSTNKWANGKVLEEVDLDQLKCLEPTQTKDGTSVKEIMIKPTQPCQDCHAGKQSHQFPTKIKIYKALVLSVLLDECENRTLTADLESRIQAFENKCYRR